MENVKEVAFKAAREAGAILRERVGKIENLDYKSAFNIVTDVDKASEKHILGLIRDAFPDHQIIAEETGEHKTSSTSRWLVDPLDGTTNFAHAYPFFSVSIGFEDSGEQQFGVVFNPMSNELFWAERGKGAFLNDTPIKVSSTAKLEASLLATGFPPDSAIAKINNMAEFARLTDLTHGVRRDASAALDLSFVACGRLDGYWEVKLGPWDVGAGTLIVREAGGTVTDLVGGPFDMFVGHITATNGKIHQELVEQLAFADRLKLDVART
jgi:myo-inositol-1(or 4)-monophosphatase